MRLNGMRIMRLRWDYVGGRNEGKEFIRDPRMQKMLTMDFF